jgi:hypothetical protein
LEGALKTIADDALKAAREFADNRGGYSEFFEALFKNYDSKKNIFQKVWYVLTRFTVPFGIEGVPYMLTAPARRVLHFIPVVGPFIDKTLGFLLNKVSHLAYIGPNFANKFLNIKFLGIGNMIQTTAFGQFLGKLRLGAAENRSVLNAFRGVLTRLLHI